MSKKSKRRLIKLRYVQRNDEDPENILNQIASQFPKADMEIDLDRLPKADLQIQRDTKLEEKAVERGNTVLDQRDTEYKEKKGLVKRFKSLKPFLVKITEGSTITLIVEVVKTFITKTP